MLETITFVLAFVGFAALATQAALFAHDRGRRGLAVVTALVVAAHVYLVWAYRYEWSLGQATRNGYAGFLIFHLALLLILLTPLVGRSVAKVTAVASFITVCVGANGAVFRYDVVAIYRIPVIACTIAGAAAVLLGARRRRRRDG